MSRPMKSHKSAMATGSGRLRRLSIGKTARVITRHGLIMITQTLRVHNAPGGKGRAADQSPGLGARHGSSRAIDNGMGNRPMRYEDMA